MRFVPNDGANQALKRRGVRERHFFRRSVSVSPRVGLQSNCFLSRHICLDIGELFLFSRYVRLTLFSPPETGAILRYSAKLHALQFLYKKRSYLKINLRLVDLHFYQKAIKFKVIMQGK